MKRESKFLAFATGEEDANQCDQIGRIFAAYALFTLGNFI
jgi:hypothetical protein